MIFATLLVLALAQTSSGAIEQASPSIIEPLKAESLHWKSRPTGNDFARAFPRRAETLDVEGAATVLCRIAADRTLRGCTTVRESPDGYQFGKAAAVLAAQFVLADEQPDPRADVGADVLLKLRFNLPGHRH